jgi:hypothetical protein
MRLLAVFVSVIAGSIFVCFCRIVFQIQELRYLFDDLLMIWWLAIFAQSIVELFLVGAKRTRRLNLIDYYWAAIYSILFLTFVFGIGEESFEVMRKVFITLFGYSIINILTYNELYFKQLEKII